MCMWELLVVRIIALAQHEEICVWQRARPIYLVLTLGGPNRKEVITSIP